MAYDTSHATQLKHLKDLAERVKAKYTTQEDFDALSEKVGNITVPTAVSELTNDSGYQTASDVATAVAAIVADAPEAYDTLVEIANWISNHADSASAMNTQINANTDDIAELKALIGTLPETATSTDVIAYISEMVNSVEAYTHPTYTAQTSGLYKITVDSTGHVSAVEAVTSSDIENLGVKITDTTYDEATTTSSGLMSASDKEKLDGIELASDSEVTEMLDEVLGATSE